ncbi:hypothetical protein PhaeoP83_04390 (plasmid) [Phaeobacter inhibens]|uniref:Uncharacterized protein n=1 Tax=Phaeobacter inhibens TaxID=221822 RepID=A0A2I7M5P6_9RHOB|nr:hypothetical protein PhaeoP83_04390 [Phaeobacter inhibens]AUQ97213.1 hypothetical protein PhaeoP66_04487 [Phaeobacter inhibens]AUR01943.1 hypothetical protein PhaeoP88_04631 [Phaeobacter inhibens]AUR22413.1 hypothetical protein PhaeoP80_04390 [Phaeobacter inhibens]
MSRLRGSKRLTLRLVLLTAPFCQGEKWIAEPCMRPVFRVRWSRSRITFMILIITGFVHLLGFFSSTVNRLTRSTSDVTFN